MLFSLTLEDVFTIAALSRFMSIDEIQMVKHRIEQDKTSTIIGVPDDWNSNQRCLYYSIVWRSRK